MRTSRIGFRGRAERGFTLVELLVALALSGIVATAAMRFLFAQTAFFNGQTEQLLIQQNTRAALHRLSSDIRLAGRGLNHYDLEIPDLIVPNDGSVSVNTFTDSTISVLSIPDPSSPGVILLLDPNISANGDAGSAQVVADSGQDLSAFVVGSRLILFDPNSGNSQVVGLTGSSGLTLSFLNDTLVYNFPATGSSPTQLLLLNEVRYRTNGSGTVSFLERRVDRGNWIRYIEGIRSIRFQYYDENADPFGSPTPFFPDTPAERRAIRWIRITIVGEAVRGDTRGHRSTMTLASDVAPRNMMPAP